MGSKSDASRLLQGAILVVEQMLMRGHHQRKAVTEVGGFIPIAARKADEWKSRTSRRNDDVVTSSIRIDVTTAPAITDNGAVMVGHNEKKIDYNITSLPLSKMKESRGSDDPTSFTTTTTTTTTTRSDRRKGVIPLIVPAATNKDNSTTSDGGEHLIKHDIKASQDSRQVDQSQSSGFKERAVPATPFARVLGFGGLAARLAVTGAYETVRRQVEGIGGGHGRMDKPYRAVMSDANAERIAETLCKMRGAALKLGQMLSIQDETLLPEPLIKALERVRQGADMMPKAQLYSQLEKELGKDWRSKFLQFEEVPIAAASIGQVHRGKTLEGCTVAIKVQYPGVADSIESDLSNLKTLVTYMNILPPGLYVDEIIDVAREELTLECDYTIEAQSQSRFRELVEQDEELRDHVFVPAVIKELSTRQVLTSEWVQGVPINRVAQMSMEVRNRVARMVLLLSVRELFSWRFMQTDPNWANFLYDEATGRLNLLDFGASREYDKTFVDRYLTLVWAAANRDTKTLMDVSQKLGFLTGDESMQMLKAHEQAGLVVGEPFISSKPFDFHGSNMTARISQHGSTFMRHRLTPPPREAYSLHRKLAGAFLICIKLRAIIPCRDILSEIHELYPWNDDRQTGPYDFQEAI